MKGFVTVAQMVAAEQRAIFKLGIASRLLMFNAGKTIADLVASKYPETRSVGITAGFGNNGGDGFVVGMLMANRSIPVNVVSLGKREQFSADATEFLNACLKHPLVKVSFAHDTDSVAREIKKVQYSDLIIDAVLGTGFSGQVRDPIATAIHEMSGRAPIVAVDIPSGLNGTTGEVSDPCIKATDTVTFARGKIGLLNHKEHTGLITVTDIGIPDICFDETKWV